MAFADSCSDGLFIVKVGLSLFQFFQQGQTAGIDQTVGFVKVARVPRIGNVVVP